MKIPITKPLFGPEELRAVHVPLQTGWVGQGSFVKEFEERFSAFTGARYCVATSSCTTALHVAVAALGLTAGDEVIVPAFTWVSTPNVVEYMGAKPVFCDIRLDTFNIDSDQVESLITPRTVGLMPVHLFGLCADVEPLKRIATKHGLWMVEDAACALGAYYDGRHAGTFGEMGCFSFHPRKSITTGEGGMIATGREDLDRAGRALRDHGAVHAAYDLLGYNYRMTDIQGALGCAQMDRAKWILAERSRRAQLYDAMLGDMAWLRRPAVPNGYVHGYQAYVCLFCPEAPGVGNVEGLHHRRDGVMARLGARGIATRQGTHAPVILGYYVGKYNLRAEEFPNAYLSDRLSLALPLYAQMTDEEQELVCRGLWDAFNSQT
jgi:dTDP-4-amino-4,6-dideoxygalactose transaminase